MSQQKASIKELCTIRCNYPVYSTIWSKSCSSDQEMLLFSTSLNVHGRNILQGFKYNHNTKNIKSIYRVKTKTPITKMDTIQFNNSNGSEYLVVSSMDLFFASISPKMDKPIDMQCLSDKQPIATKSSFPICSFATTTNSNPFIYSAHTDTWVDIWDFSKARYSHSIKVEANGICYDIDVCRKNQNLFTTVGLTGLISIVDSRSNEPSHIESESIKHEVPLVRVSWCPTNTNYIAALPFEDSRVYLFDYRYLKKPVFISKVHKCKVNSVYWNPYKQATLITTDESGTCIEWSIIQDESGFKYTQSTLCTSPSLTQFVISPVNQSLFASCKENDLSICSI